MIPMEILLQATQVNDPVMFLQQRYGNTPAYQKTMAMMQGKNPQQIQQVVFNLAKQKGIDINQLMQMANVLGLRL